MRKNVQIGLFLVPNEKYSITENNFKGQKWKVLLNELFHYCHHCPFYAF